MKKDNEFSKALREQFSNLEFNYSGMLGSLLSEEPVPLDVFVADRAYLGQAPLSPIQYDAVRHIERIYFDGWEKDDDGIYTYHPEKDLYAALGAEFGEYWSTPVRMVNFITLMFGKGSGKDYCAGVSALRIAYLLMCLKNPQGYFGMPSSTQIHMLNVAATAHQATRAYFNPLRSIVQNGWFADRCTPMVNAIQFDKGIEAISGNSETESQEGSNLILGVADETDAFKSREAARASGRREAVNTVEGILDMMRSSGAPQPLFSKVLTPDRGFVAMDDLRVGDYVVDPDGEESRIIQIHPEGFKPVYRLTFSDGTSALAADCHLWSMVGEDGESGTWTTEELKRDLEKGLNSFRLPVVKLNTNLKLKGRLSSDRLLSYLDGSRYLISVEFEDYLNCKCITVTASSHLYFTDGLIPTHNSRFRTFKNVRISFPRFVGSPIMQLMDRGNKSIAKLGVRSPHYTSGPYATWEVNPLRRKSDFADEYEEDPVEAAAKYECRPARASTPYFRNVVLTTDAFSQDTPTLKVKGYTKEGWSWEPEYEFPPEFVPIRGAIYSMHGDLAVNGDKAGIAMAHTVRNMEFESESEEEGEEETTVTQYRPLIKVDFVIAFEADLGTDPPREIQLRWARELATKLIQRGFKVQRYTFDGYHSLESIQWLEQEYNMESKKVSTDRTIEPYKVLRDLMYEGRVQIPKDDSLLNEILSLNVKFGKIDHPALGSKDRSDALACAVMGAVELGGEEDPEGARDYFSTSQFETGGLPGVDLPFGFDRHNVGFGQELDPLIWDDWSGQSLP